MQRDDIKTLFDQQAAGYDERWAKTAPIRDALHFLLRAVFARLPADARVLCVGAGTGDEIVELANRFPGWRFVAVEPSGVMLDLCRRKAEAGGFADRCGFHEGFLDSLPATSPFDAATCVLVSQFILDRDARIGFFRGIAERLRPGGVLASADLAADVASPEYEALLRVWLDMLLSAGMPAAGLDQIRQVYARDVAILPPAQVEALLRAGGFDTPVLFHQAGLIHAWFSTRADFT
ncbi:MAG: class I SAM-dependent methyltransferase [Lysobacter sp.]|nr:class I SAM-dependent methyltransferase [Lysobacter sp.]